MLFYPQHFFYKASHSLSDRESIIAEEKTASIVVHEAWTSESPNSRRPMR